MNKHAEVLTPSDQNAGLEGYLQSGVDELHCPLMVIIGECCCSPPSLGAYISILSDSDYRGYRLTAMSTLPISKDTLYYGSKCTFSLKTLPTLFVLIL